MNKNADKIQVLLPKEVEDRFEMLQTIINPDDADLALLFMGENVVSKSGNNLRLIRLLLARKIETDYELDGEINTFVFGDEEAAQSFLAAVPNMSLIEFFFKSNYQDFVIDEKLHLL